MNQKSIIRVLESFAENCAEKSLLINGPWGCGKTYLINEFMKVYNHKHSNRKCLYVSAFGIDSLDALKLNIAEQRSKIFKFVNEASQIVSFKDKYSIDVVHGLEFAMNKLSSHIFDGHILIIDDLERLSLKIGYDDLLGWCNNLFIRNFKLICIISTDNISKDERKKQFQQFKEKVFDSELVIKESIKDALDYVFDREKTCNISSLYKMFDNNIRKAQRTKNLYRKIEQLCIEKDSSIEQLGFDRLDIIKACIIAISLEYDLFEDFNIQDKAYMLDYYSDQYGKNVANGICSIKDNYPDINSYTIDLSLRLYSYCIYKDDSELCTYLGLNFEKGTINDILNKEFFYLSDEHKKEYISELEKELISANFQWNSWIQQRLNDALLYSDYMPSEKIINGLSESIAKDTKYGFDDKNDVLTDYYSQAPSYKQFYESLKIRIMNNLKERIVHELNDAYLKQDYASLINLLQNRSSFNNGVKAEFDEQFEKKDFFLPDLSGDISSVEWTYSHNVFREYANIYRGKLEEITNRNMSNCDENSSLYKRYHSLKECYLTNSTQ